MISLQVAHGICDLCCCVGQLSLVNTLFVVSVVVFVIAPISVKVSALMLS